MDLLKFPPGLIPVFQSSVSPLNWGRGVGGSEGRLVSSWVSACCTDIGYQLVCIRSSLVKFQGGRVVLKFHVLPEEGRVLCSLHASNETVLFC